MSVTESEQPLQQMYSLLVWNCLEDHQGQSFQITYLTDEQRIGG